MAPAFNRRLFGRRTLAGPSPRTYVARVRFVTIAGVALAVFGSLRMPIWWHLPWLFHLVSAAYDVTAWLVAGLVLAAFIKPPLRPSAEAAFAA